jgi:hypothetical protein
MYSNTFIKQIRVGINKDMPRVPNKFFAAEPISDLLPETVSYALKNSIAIAKDSTYLTKAIMCNACQLYSIFELGYIQVFDMTMNSTVPCSELNKQIEYQLIEETGEHVILNNIVTVKKNNDTNDTLLSVSGEIKFSKKTIDAIFNESIADTVIVESPVLSIKATDAYFCDALYHTVND